MTLEERVALLEQRLIALEKRMRLNEAITDTISEKITAAVQIAIREASYGTP